MQSLTLKYLSDEYIKGGRKDPCLFQHPHSVTDEESETALGLGVPGVSTNEEEKLYKEKSGRTKDVLGSWSHWVSGL